MGEYSLDLRQRLVEAVEQGLGTKREIARLFSVSENFLYKLLRQQRQLGHFEPLPHGGGAVAKLDSTARSHLQTLVEADPDATLSELAERLHRRHRIQVSRATICRALQQLDLRRKKSRARQSKPIP